MKIQRTENCNKALAFLKAAKIKLVGIGSGDIEGGNEKLILGLLWPVKISRSIFTHWGFRVTLRSELSAFVFESRATG